MSFSRLANFATLVIVAAAATACSSDSTGPSAPNPVLGAAASSTSSASATVTFTSVAGDNSYLIERAEGATGTFASDTTITAPATASPISVVRTGLKPATVYRFRVTTTRGSQSSVPSGEFTTTTLPTGTFAADITTDVTASRTLFADTTYTLKGFIHVGNGATLTIQPGTKIVGDFLTLGSSLMILKGAKIQAVGTAALPIVFTSSRAAGSRQPGDWGGLLLVGNAPDNRSGTVNVEGTGTDGATVVGGKNYFVQYNGGTVATDNSGTLAYVRVEFGGYATLQDQEFNSFTFCALGSGTRASYLESLAGLDDSFEFFGGGFDIDHLIAYETADDMFDMSEGWSGRMQFLIGYNSVQLVPRTGAGNYSVDIEGIENDGCNGTGCDLGFNSTPFTVPLVANYTMIGCGATTCSGSGGGHGLMLRRGTGGFYVNGVVARFPVDGISLRDSLTFVRAARAATPDVTTSDLAVLNNYFVETPKVFQDATAPGVAVQQNVFDLTGNSLVLAANTVTTASLFTALPATGSVPSGLSAFDFTPVAGSAIATGGLATFTGKIATKGGTFITGTAYRGAADPSGAKWWTGWTAYARN